jgi:hypothetical protein
MRHMTGAALAVALAIVLFFAGSWGYLKLTAGRAGSRLPAGGGSLLHDRAVLEGFGALLAVGLVAGIFIAVPAISPLAAGLPGLTLLAWTGLYLAGARRAIHYIPLKSGDFGTGFEALLVNGVLAVAGLAMIFPLFVPSRWRRPAAAPVQPYPAEYADVFQTPASGGGLMDEWADTRPQARLDLGHPQAPWAPAEPGWSAQPPDYR